MQKIITELCGMVRGAGVARAIKRRKSFELKKCVIFTARLQKTLVFLKQIAYNKGVNLNCIFRRHGNGQI